MSVSFIDCSLLIATYPLVGYWRHETALCRPGLYRVVFCIDDAWGSENADAVVDDFGNLVKVKQ